MRFSFPFFLSLQIEFEMGRSWERAGVTYKMTLNDHGILMDSNIWDDFDCRLVLEADDDCNQLLSSTSSQAY